MILIIFSPKITNIPFTTLEYLECNFCGELKSIDCKSLIEIVCDECYSLEYIYAENAEYIASNNGKSNLIIKAPIDCKRRITYIKSWC